MYTFQAIQILIFLIPGFISGIILDNLVVRKAKSEFGTVIEALIFSLIILVIYSQVISKSPIELTVINAPATASTSTYTLNSQGFLWLFVFSVLLPLPIAFLMTYDLHMKLLRFLHITKRTARENVWLDTFLDEQRYVVINFTDGRRITGWPKYYSDDKDSQYVYLTNAAWIVENMTTKQEEFKEIDMDGVLITNQPKIDSIMFYRDTEY
jgi:hypothetical protein